MTDSQPPGAPSSQWVIRSDAGARKVVDEIRDLKKKIEVFDDTVSGFEHSLGQFVTYKWLITVAGALAAVIVVASYSVTSIAAGRAENAAKSAVQKVEQHEISHKTEMEKLQGEVSANSRRIEDKLDRYLFRRSPPRRSTAPESTGGDE